MSSNSYTLSPQATGPNCPIPVTAAVVAGASVGAAAVGAVVSAVVDGGAVVEGTGEVAAVVAAVLGGEAGSVADVTGAVLVLSGRGDAMASGAVVGTVGWVVDGSATFAPGCTTLIDVAETPASSRVEVWVSSANSAGDAAEGAALAGLSKVIAW